MFSFILLDDISLSITFGACSQIMTMVTTIPAKATVSGCDGDSLRMHTHLGFLVFSYYIVGQNGQFLHTFCRVFIWQDTKDIVESDQILVRPRTESKRVADSADRTDVLSITRFTRLEQDGGKHAIYKRRNMAHCQNQTEKLWEQKMFH